MVHVSAQGVDDRMNSPAVNQATCIGADSLTSVRGGKKVVEGRGVGGYKGIADTHYFRGVFEDGDFVAFATGFDCAG